MTQTEAVIKALENLGGKASLRQIYDLAKKYTNFGTKTPEESIRTILQRSPKTKQTEKRSGWWELASYQEEIEKLKKDAANKDAIIRELENKLTPVATFERMANTYMDASMNKDKDDRKIVRDSLNRIKSTLNLSVSSDVNNRIESFGTDLPKPKINVDGNNNGVIGDSIGINLSSVGEETLIKGLLNSNNHNNDNNNQG